MIEQLKAALRNTLVHKAYGFMKYVVPDVLGTRIWGSLRLGRTGKVLRYLADRLLHHGQDRPVSVVVDVVSVCNLRCPLCSVPPFITKAEGNFMPLELFSSILGSLGQAVTDLVLVYAGEPYLNPDFGKMLAAAAPDYYLTVISNATLFNEKNIGLTVDTVDYLQVSFDGHSKESYEKYRVGADFAKVKGNLEAMLAARNASRSGLPRITVTFLINAYNEHEVQESRAYWLGRGADHFYAKFINLNVHRRTDGQTAEDLAHWLPKNRRNSLYATDGDKLEFKPRVGPCLTWNSPVIHCTGEVLLCCHDIFNSVKIGNVLERPFREIWNDPEYRKIRSLARERRLPVCQKCGK